MMTGNTTIPVLPATKKVLRDKRLKMSLKAGRELTWDEFLKKLAG